LTTMTSRSLQPPKGGYPDRVVRSSCKTAPKRKRSCRLKPKEHQFSDTSAKMIHRRLPADHLRPREYSDATHAATKLSKNRIPPSLSCGGTPQHGADRLIQTPASQSDTFFAVFLRRDVYPMERCPDRQVSSTKKFSTTFNKSSSEASRNASDRPRSTTPPAFGAVTPLIGRNVPHLERDRN